MSEPMVDRVLDECGPVGCCSLEERDVREIWAVALSASPAIEGDHGSLRAQEPFVPTGEADGASAVLWAVERWKAEVENRPLVNKNRRALDDTWRQVIRHFGGDPGLLLPLDDHDTLIASRQSESDQ